MNLKQIAFDIDELKTLDCEVCGDAVGVMNKEAYIMIDMLKCAKCHAKNRGGFSGEDADE